MGLLDQIKESQVRKEHEKPMGESPAIVQGGPLDPASPEGAPPEGTTTEPVVTPPPAAPTEPIYRGFTGDIKTPEELKTYAKTLEDTLVQLRTQQPLAQATAPVMTPPPAVVPADRKTQFEEIVFTKPGEAFELAVAEATDRINQRDTARENVQKFWNDFYVKNSDLKRFDNVVQSIRVARAQEISALKTSEEVEKFISAETRKMIDLVKREAGVKETVLPSGQATALGGSREPAPQIPQAPAQPENFTAQIRRLKPGGRK